MLLLSKELPNLDYRPTLQRFDEDWRDPLATLLGWGRAAGADLVEIFLERVNSISCLAEDDAITSITPRLATGAGVRVFRGLADCYVSTNDLSFAGLKAALEKGLLLMGLTPPQALPPWSPLSTWGSCRTTPSAAAKTAGSKNAAPLPRWGRSWGGPTQSSSGKLTTSSPAAPTTSATGRRSW